MIYALLASFGCRGQVASIYEQTHHIHFQSFPRLHVLLCAQQETVSSLLSIPHCLTPERERERESLSWFCPQMPVTIRAKLTPGARGSLCFLMWVAGTQVLRHPMLLAWVHVSGDLDRKWRSQD